MTSQLLNRPPLSTKLESDTCQNKLYVRNVPLISRICKLNNWCSTCNSHNNLSSKSCNLITPSSVAMAWRMGDWTVPARDKDAAQIIRGQSRDHRTRAHWYLHRFSRCTSVVLPVSSIEISPLELPKLLNLSWPRWSIWQYTPPFWPTSNTGLPHLSHDIDNEWTCRELSVLVLVWLLSLLTRYLSH